MDRRIPWKVLNLWSLFPECIKSGPQQLPWTCRSQSLPTIRSHPCLQNMLSSEQTVPNPGESMVCGACTRPDPRPWRASIPQGHVRVGQLSLLCRWEWGHILHSAWECHFRPNKRTRLFANSQERVREQWRALLCFRVIFNCLLLHGYHLAGRSGIDRVTLLSWKHSKCAFWLMEEDHQSCHLGKFSW